MSTLLVAVSLAFTSAAPAPSPFLDTIAEMSLPGVEVSPMIITCGGVNAAYVPATHTVIMCAETLEEPDYVIRFITAHEMAHAIIDQYRIPVPASEEAAADELAAVVMGVTDAAEITLGMANWYAEHPDGGEDIWDDHQSAAKRAAVLVCLGDGSNEDAVIPDCRQRYLKAEYTWSRLLTTFGPE